MSDLEKELVFIRPFIPEELIPFISEIECIGMLLWQPEYYDWIKAYEHDKMLSLLKLDNKFTMADNLLVVYKVSFNKQDLYPLLLYVYSPVELWEDDSLILMDKYPV